MSLVALGPEMKIRRSDTAARGRVALVRVLDRERFAEAAMGVGGRRLRGVRTRTRQSSCGGLSPIRRVHRLFKLVPIPGDDNCWVAQQTEVSKYGVQVEGIHVRWGQNGSR